MSLLISPTQAKLLSNVRNLLNQPNEANSFWSDAEIIEYLNEGCRVYFAEVVENNEGQFGAVTDLDVVSGVETIDLPTDCYEVRAAYKKTSSGYSALPYQNIVDRDYLSTGNTGNDTYFPSYYFRQNKLVLRPIPNFSETASIRLEYIQFPDTLVNGGDRLTSQISPIFKQVIEMYAVYKAKLKESLVNGVALHTVAKENFDALYIQFKDSIRSRSKYPQYTNPYNPEGNY